MIIRRPLDRGKIATKDGADPAIPSGGLMIFWYPVTGVCGGAKRAASVPSLDT
jgi:hypothetical protein